MEKRNLNTKMIDKKFIKKYWDEENVLFYIHFENGLAIQQIEIRDLGKVRLSLNNPFEGDSMLYDQQLDDLDLSISDFITEEEFNEVWNN